MEENSTFVLKVNGGINLPTTLGRSANQVGFLALMQNHRQIERLDNGLSRIKAASLMGVLGNFLG